jgi:hypothetical protein
MSQWAIATSKTGTFWNIPEHSATEKTRADAIGDCLEGLILQSWLFNHRRTYNENQIAFLACGGHGADEIFEFMVEGRR